MEALVRGQAIPEKVAEEGKPHPLASGALRLSLGLMYVSTIEDFTGLTGAIVFARPRFDLFLDGRIGAGRDIDFWFSSVGVGGRFFFTVTDLAPFVGAGFGQTSVTIPNQGFTKGGSGGWPWLEAGVQFLRTRRVQLTLGVRADLPFSNMALSRGSYPDYRAQEGYRVPITFTATAGLFLGRLTMWRMTDDPGRHARPTALALALLSAPAVARGQADARPTPEPAAFTCGAGDLAGIPPTDAATAVDLVCRDVARVSRRPPGAYTVALTAVGRSVVLTLSLKHPSGRVEERSATLFGIEDVVTASPRVVGALVESQGMPEVKPSGEFGISVGPIVVNLPAAGALLVPGLTLGVAYEVRQAAAVFDLRLATHRNGALQAGYLALSAGGRYHFTRSDTAPFASAGLALAAVIEDYYYDQSEQTAFGGLAPWLEVGVTVFRTRRFQLAASVRANFPLGAMKGEDRRATPESERIIKFRHYEVPITLASTFTF